jgi:hypothetical protein
MSYEIYGWLITMCLLLLVALIVKVTWMIGVENGYDKGYSSGYLMGTRQITARQITARQISPRENQLKQDNEYLMGRVVQLFDQESK